MVRPLGVEPLCKPLRIHKRKKPYFVRLLSVLIKTKNENIFYTIPSG